MDNRLFSRLDAQGKNDCIPDHLRRVRFPRGRCLNWVSATVVDRPGCTQRSPVIRLRSSTKGRRKPQSRMARTDIKAEIDPGQRPSSLANTWNNSPCGFRPGQGATVSYRGRASWPWPGSARPFPPERGDARGEPRAGLAIDQEPLQNVMRWPETCPGPFPGRSGTVWPDPAAARQFVGEDAGGTRSTTPRPERPGRPR